MLAHIIHYKGKGFLVLVLPIFVAFILFVTFGIFAIDDKYVRPTTLLLSSVIIWLVDNRENSEDGMQSFNAKSNNTFMWIAMKFWSIPLAVAGIIALVYL